MEEIRQSKFKVIYSGKDITEDIAGSVIEINYTDNINSDDLLEITVENRDGRWFKGWFPEDGDEIEVYAGWKELYPFGKFTVKRVSFYPKAFTAVISAVSHNIKRSIRRTKKNRSFENTTLRKIVEKIAEENGLEPIVSVPEIPIKRIDQTDQTDAQFLKNLSEKFGCNFKIAGNKLSFIDEKELESTSPLLKVSAENTEDIELHSDAGKTYKACEVIYYDAKTGKQKKYIYQIPGEKVGEILKSRERVENLQQAMSLARSLLRTKNRKKRTVSFTCGGVPLFAGMTFQLEGFGQMDGKYIVERANHRIAGIWKVNVEARKCLNW